MKPIFTIHAGEYLVGDFLEKQFPECDVWIPSKDTGTDLLIANSRNRKRNIGIQVKFSKDFLPQMEASFHGSLSACGWWTLNSDKTQHSNAELWVLAAYSFVEKRVQHIIIEPKELLKRLNKIHGQQKSINTYLWVTQDGKCFETRGLNKETANKLITGDYSCIPSDRNFSE